MEDDPRATMEKDSPSALHEKGGVLDLDGLGTEIQALSHDIIEAQAHSQTMTEDEVHQAIRLIIDEHGDDPNFPPQVIIAARRYVSDQDLSKDPVQYQQIYEELKIQAALIAINSPYAEVRAVVHNHDDQTVPSNTFRSWVLGIVFVAIGGFINQFFSIRQPGITVGPNVVQVLAYPAGKFCERVLPTTIFNTFGYRWSLNPGPFNIKEHMMITIMANVGFVTPYTTYVIWVQYVPRFFNQRWAANFGYQILVGLSTNFIGYGLAGLTRRFLVYPSYAIWPSNLAIIALNRAFHDNTDTIANGWRMSKIRYFLICFIAMFVYFWFPNFIFQALSYFNWMTWIAPQNVVLAAVTGGVTGLGLNPISTFDWNQLVIGGDPIVNPFFSIANGFAGTLLTFPIIIAIWFTNTWYTGYFPINSNGVFDNTGERYNVSKIVDANARFDLAAYKSYSPPYLAAGNVLLYGIFFALYTSTITHTVLYHRREISHGFRSFFNRTTVSDGHDDVHTRLMRSYKEVPEWVYFSVLVISMALGAAGVGAYPNHTTPAVVLYGVFLAAVFAIPCGIIQSITNVQITLNVLAELLGGLWFPGNATAMNYFKTYGYVTTAHTLNFVQDLKLAHYVHIPPRVTFACQMVATVVSTFVSTAILDFQMTQISNVCGPDQKDHFTCPGVNTFFTSSVLWGTLGTKRVFGSGAIYNGLVYGFLIGAVLPIPFYVLRKRFRIFEYVHFPVILSGGLIWAPYNLQNVWPAVPVAYLFNVFVKRRYLAWWSKYNYITSGAFSSAIAISAIVMFFGLQWSGIEINWSGNSWVTDGCDGTGCPLFDIPEVGYFGPAVGEFS